MNELDDFDELGPEEPEDGETIEMGPDSLGGSNQVRSRDDALDGGLPLLLLHREHRYNKSLPVLIDQLHGTSAASLSLGVVVNLPRVKQEAARAWLTDPCAASVRIADPELYARPDMWGPTLLLERDGPPRDGEPAKSFMPKTTTPLWAYWNRPLPAGPTEQWVAEVLDAQREAGANLLLTPGVPLDQHTPQAALDELERQVSWARESLENGERLAVNVTVETPWLASQALRTRLLNMVVESDERTWYVRVKWPFQQSYAQLVDEGLLDGYRELAALMEDEERTLLLPTSGDTGWLALAWGATGFGTGIGSAARGFTTGRPIRRKSPAPAQPRYYEQPLLHNVEATTADALARIQGYTACPCMYCFELRHRPTWSPELSGCHYLLAIGERTAALAGGSGRRGVARRMVRAARRTRDWVVKTVPLTDRDSPSHLDLWEERLV